MCLATGSMLHRLFPNRMDELAKSAFPEVLLLAWRFRAMPAAFWQNETNQRQFVDHIRKQAGLDSGLTDLYGLQWYQLEQFSAAGKALRKRYPTIPALVAKLYPEQTWQESSFVSKWRCSL